MEEIITSLEESVLQAEYELSLAKLEVVYAKKKVDLYKSQLLTEKNKIGFKKEE